MIDNANLPNPLYSHSTLPLTRTHIYLLAAALLAVWALYSAWRRHAIKCFIPLGGPALSSFLLGGLSLAMRRVSVPLFYMILAGNTPDLYSAPHGIAYPNALSATFGGAFKIPINTRLALQEEQIYLSDTRALTHVLVRDTRVFDETRHRFPYHRSPRTADGSHRDSEFYYCFGSGLISVRGDTHKRQRKMIQLLLRAAHIRGLTPTFWGMEYQLSDVIRACAICP
ncbi:hypothetical protein B0H19DRAFT_1276212 [Mycena capillaripes]|nr:hypothetical protein B0H19DRAFT_1276212 [Mycena capillaripes]